MFTGMWNTKKYLIYVSMLKTIINKFSNLFNLPVTLIIGSGVKLKEGGMRVNGT